MLAPGASDDELVRAAAAHQTAWMARTAEAAGGVVHRDRGATWMASPAGTVLAFPRLSRARLDTGGIGSALTAAALRIGERAGCAVATLNATQEGELLYRQLGFRFVGVAQTRWR